jgi:hypothetical protein
MGSPLLVNQQFLTDPIVLNLGGYFFFLIMIPVIYKFYQKKKYRGTTFALLYAKHRDELKRGSGQGNQTQTVK